MATIAFKEITKCYSNAHAPAVDAVTFDVLEGSTCMLVGTSGSGKTTLLRMVNRLIEPTSGQIMIDGKNVLSENPILLRRRLRQLQYVTVNDALDTDYVSTSTTSNGNLPTSTANTTLLAAMLRLLETNAPVLVIQQSDPARDTPGYVTLASINREVSHLRQKARASGEAKG